MNWELPTRLPHRLSQRSGTVDEWKILVQLKPGLEKERDPMVGIMDLMKELGKVRKIADGGDGLAVLTEQGLML
ncbi:hypothetical protein C5167_020613 [Papaver somniferum]|uniref:Uncharacterized protein n=1 Tax=Papaver somniferum TaxID=3469 RepID=A0A4Y7IWR6_PAPSO|nr:hypothetical protein C5167_020613 [Papaver somniferum]